jgi:hypothetical protein
MLSVVMLNVVMLSVVPPLICYLLLRVEKGFKRMLTLKRIRSKELKDFVDKKLSWHKVIKLFFCFFFTISTLPPTFLPLPYSFELILISKEPFLNGKVQ